jgi:DNA-directed RNA polymerase subunit N (RpoN/RPB10)
MIIPIRCKSCGKPIGHFYEEFIEKSEKKSKKEVLDEFGLKRYCCRAHFMGHVNLVDTTAEFKKF